MPVYEFEEIEIPKKQKLPGYIPQGSLPEKTGSETEKEKRKVNYWGYAKGSYFAPKASYGYSKNVTRELKHLIDTLHQNQMECVMEMYFEQEENQNLILDALRYWATGISCRWFSSDRGKCADHCNRPGFIPAEKQDLLSVYPGTVVEGEGKLSTSVCIQ